MSHSEWLSNQDASLMVELANVGKFFVLFVLFIQKCQESGVTKQLIGPLHVACTAVPVQ